VHATKRAWDVVAQGWYLGFTAFGGPPVHFKIVRIALLHSLAGALGAGKDLRAFAGKGRGMRSKGQNHRVTC
jgi:hypothetical protein